MSIQEAEALVGEGPNRKQVVELIDLLNIETLDTDLYRGSSPENRGARVFGGQVIAQALVAAYRTVDAGVPCHSLHGYFMRPGNPKRPIIFQVDRARDGRSFFTRRVIALQDGKQIFNLASSFHKREKGFEHASNMPDVAGPEGLEDRQKQRQRYVEKLGKFGKDFVAPGAFLNRPVEPYDLLEPEKGPASQSIWLKLGAELKTDDMALHHCLMAYASDMSLLSTGNRPHGVSWLNGDFMTASLDHAMWFHDDIRADQWHVFSQDSPWAGSARSFNRGEIFTQAGKLVCSCTQEGLFRPLK